MGWIRMGALAFLITCGGVAGTAACAWARIEGKVRGRVGLEFLARGPLEDASIDREGELRFETGRKDGLEAVVDLSVAAESSGVDLDDLYLDIKNANGSRWILGQTRLRFGLDADQDVERRLALGRSAVYRKLQAYSYAGKDMTIRYRTGETHSSVGHEASIHASDALRAAAIYRMQLQATPTIRLESTTLVQRQVIQGRGRYSAAQAFSYVRQLGSARLQAELLAGNDMIEAEFLEASGTPGNVIFATAQLGGSWKIARFEPFVRGAALLHELPHWSDHTRELSLGARYFARERLQLGLQVTLLRSVYDGFGAPKGFHDSGSSALVAARYFF